MIIKTYFEEIICLLLVFFVGICSIILCTNLSDDYDEKKCVEFYLENNYVLSSCEEYKKDLEALKE